VDRVIRVSSSFERQGEVKMSCSQPWVQSDRLPEPGDGSRKVTAVGDEDANRIVGHRIPRVQRNRFTESGERCRGVAAGHQ